MCDTSPIRAYLPDWLQEDLRTPLHIDSAPGPVPAVTESLRRRFRVRTKSRAGQRVLVLPSWVVAMLTRRRAAGIQLDKPVFPDSRGGYRDPSNTSRDLREARGTEDLSWVTSHAFRKTLATMLDDAGLSPRAVADQLGHARPSMTQDVYLSRKVLNPHAATAIEGALATLGRCVLDS